MGQIAAANPAPRMKVSAVEMPPTVRKAMRTEKLVVAAVNGKTKTLAEKPARKARAVPHRLAVHAATSAPTM
jgi:hypothetical protein